MERKGYVAIVGSRNVPEPILEIFIRLGRTFTDLGYAVSSGDAYGSDRAGWYGAIQSEHYATVGARIYLHKDYANQRKIKDFPNFHDARWYTDTLDEARALASAARGGFYGLYENGIMLHTRNVFQIHGHTLQELVKGLVCYAQPIGNRENEKVKGGTATALTLAKNAGVPFRWNLWHDDTMTTALAWLAKYESSKPYCEIDWREIHDPRDPRLDME